jgi:hypothetical protein
MPWMPEPYAPVRALARRTPSGWRLLFAPFYWAMFLDLCELFEIDPSFAAMR